MNHQYVRPLADPEAKLANDGGKGASLSRLAAADLPVPEGFHVTTTAYRHFVAHNQLQPRVLEALEQVDTKKPSMLETASQRIRLLFEEAEMPEVIVPLRSCRKKA